MNWYGYVIEVKTEQLHYQASRTKEESATKFDFEINNNGETALVQLDIKEDRHVQIKSPSLGNISFLVGENRLVLAFDEKVETGTITEKVVVDMQPKDTKQKYPIYSYYIRKSIKKFNSIALQMDFEEESVGKIKTRETKYKGDQLATVMTDHVKGDILTAIRKQKLGLEAFDRFRFLINNVLPLKGEVIETLLKDMSVNWPELSIFMPDIAEKQEENLKIAI
ncbi:MAG: hypothetical protein K2M17_00255 [Bacilli bacterium]|nr:hypothetical protein [Bacilli bacterium]